MQILTTRKRAVLSASGFTLIELSIVLVIIGLIVGGVLVGRDLITSASARAQISQIEKYNQATNTFRVKYAYLPGDIPDPDASRFGFMDTIGNGNGILDGGTYWGSNNILGEHNLFWVYLKQAGLIQNSVILASGNFDTDTDGTKVSDYFPVSLLGSSKHIYVWGGGLYGAPDGKNYFSLSTVSRACGYNLCGAWSADTSGLPKTVRVSDAHAIDTKMDDGLPQSGGVQAFYFGNCGGGNTAGKWSEDTSDYYAGNGSMYVPPDSPLLSTNFSAIAASTTTCYDNGNVAGNIRKYSISTNNGAGANCALSFKFQ